MQLSRLVARQIDPYVAEVSGLGQNDFLVLHSVALGFHTPGSIADRLTRSAPSIARALRYLEGEGLVRIEDDPVDRRRRLASITERGRERHAFAMRAAAERFDALYPDIDPGTVSAAASALEAVWAQIGRDEGYADDPPRRS